MTRNPAPENRIFIGTSGWIYPHWKNFYGETAKPDWLGFCARHFTAIEVNTTFYGLQKPETFEKWNKQTPADFRFSIKGNRYITHTKRLLDPDEPVGRERRCALALQEKLAAVIWQLPKNFKVNTVRLKNFLIALDNWTETRHAVEFRHSSWFSDETADLLSKHRVAICQSDAADWPLWDRVNTDLVYVRLHGHRQTYVSAYSKKSLNGWAEKIKTWKGQHRDVHVYFDNDAEGAAPLNAMQLLDIINNQG